MLVVFKVVYCMVSDVYVFIINLGLWLDCMLIMFILLVNVGGVYVMVFFRELEWFMKFVG